uniref:Uncharacterized protein n=1 Tax=viral metagenome TaxID=1070528 RepID=A0A6C0D5Y5_9ZZZZ
MSKLNILESIKSYVFNIIEDEYKKYLQSHKLLTLQRSTLVSIMEEYYSNNSKSIKAKIREHMKTLCGEEYNSAMIENILLDLFQERELNIIKITTEIISIQEKNMQQFTIPLVNNSLNLNISLVDGYIIINSTNPKNIEGYCELYETINNYKFLYSINNDLIQDYSDDEKINIIKKNIEASETNITIACYYLKQQQEP